MRGRTQQSEGTLRVVSEPSEDSADNACVQHLIHHTESQAAAA